jgi:hypothetical protein
MKCSAGIALLLLMPLTEFASAQAAPLNAQQQLGQQLVT